MSRRRTDQPPPDRLAALLGVAVRDVDGSAPTRPGIGLDAGRAHADPGTGWVPGRADVELAAPPRSGRPAAPRDDGRHRRPTPPRPALLTVPVSLRGASVRPRRMAVLGLLLVLAVAAGVFGVRVAWARSSSRPEPVPAAAASGAATGLPTGLLARSVPAAFAPSAGGATVPGAPPVVSAPAPAPGAAGTTGMTVATGVVVVHVVGAVVRSGVVRLTPGSRVLDAVSAAGGAAPGADLPQLNLARIVADGEQIHVPRKGETLPPGGVPGSGSGSGAGAAVGSGTAGGGAGATGATPAAALVDLNGADVATLDTLPGVGPVLAQRILDWRTEHGRFSSVDELGEVSGIGDKLLAQIGPKVRV